MDVPNIATDVGQLAHLQAVHTAACMHGLVLYIYVVTTTALGSALGSSIQSRTSISSCSIVLSLRSAAFYSQSTQVCACVLVWVGACVVRCAMRIRLGCTVRPSTSLLSLKPYDLVL